MLHLTLITSLAGALLTGAMGLVAGCTRSHRMRAVGETGPTVCRECCEQAVRVWGRSVYGYAGGRWSCVPSTRVHAERRCASCDSTTVVHADDGRWAIACPACAPEGVPCDKCLPGEGVVRPATKNVGRKES